MRQARVSWHGVAELLLAGPQHRRSGTIRLRVTGGGFSTVAAPELRVECDHLLVEDRRIPLHGRTYADVGADAGVDVGAPLGLYHEGSGVSATDVVSLAAADVATLADALRIGDAALRSLAPDEAPVLWPEHFDVAITLHEVNYGVSPGDGYLDEPYAYVGPWQQRTGPFWNAPFGAARSLRDLPDAAAVAAFFAEGRSLV